MESESESFFTPDDNFDFDEIDEKIGVADYSVYILDCRSNYIKEINI